MTADEAERLLAPLFDQARHGTALLRSLTEGGGGDPGCRALRAALESQRELLLQEQQLLRETRRELLEQLECLS